MLILLCSHHKHWSTRNCSDYIIYTHKERSPWDTFFAIKSTACGYRYVCTCSIVQSQLIKGKVSYVIQTVQSDLNRQKFVKTVKIICLGIATICHQTSKRVKPQDPYLWKSLPRDYCLEKGPVLSYAAPPRRCFEVASRNTAHVSLACSKQSDHKILIAYCHNPVPSEQHVVVGSFTDALRINGAWCALRWCDERVWQRINLSSCGNPFVSEHNNQQ